MSMKSASTERGSTREVVTTVARPTFFNVGDAKCFKHFVNNGNGLWIFECAFNVNISEEEEEEDTSDIKTDSLVRHSKVFISFS